MAARENIIGPVVGIEAPVGDGGIDRNAAGIGKQPRCANSIRDPIGVATSGSGHGATLNLEATRIPVQSNARPHDIGELSCGHDTPLGGRQGKDDSDVMALNDKVAIGKISSRIRRRGNVPRKIIVGLFNVESHRLTRDPARTANRDGFPRRVIVLVCGNGRTGGNLSQVKLARCHQPN